MGYEMRWDGTLGRESHGEATYGLGESERVAETWQ